MNTLSLIVDQLDSPIIRVLTRKFTQWAYEGERRILLDSQAHKYLRFDPRALVAVVTGCRAPQYVLDAVASLIEERAAAGLPRLHHFVASQHPRKYQLVIKRAPAPAVRETPPAPPAP